MEIADILHQLERVTGKFPQPAVEAAVERREEITPHLLHILEDTVERATELAAEDDYMAHLYAMFLLAQFCETRAYPLVVRFASLPEDLLDSLCGDFITADLGQVLASVCGGELAGIQALIENENIGQWVRGAAVGSLVTLVAAREKSRDEVVAYFAALYRGKIARTWSNVWDELVSCSADLCAAELIDDIRRAYEEELVDPSFVRLQEVEQDFDLGPDRALAKLAQDPNHHLVNDTAAEMRPWVCVREDGQPREKAAAPPPVQKPAPPKPKVGRNDPCPCGSGRKYKKCCGA